jgi:hypothetical protein
MKFLCLAYGDAKHWNALTEDEQNELLAQDEMLRTRGDLVAALEPPVWTVRAPQGVPDATPHSFAFAAAPLAGFSIIEAAGFSEAIELVAQTPCARAGGAVELRPISGGDVCGFEAVKRSARPNGGTRAGTVEAQHPEAGSGI